MKKRLYLFVLILILATLASFGWSRIHNKPPQDQVVQASPLQTMDVPSQFTDKSVFLTPIKLSSTTPSTKNITGITVPHHLLAADLIANTFKFASKTNPKQILLISPDHFNLGRTDVSISQTNFSTCFGQIETNTEAVKQLQSLSFISVQDFFYREHGLGAELPFIKYYFPNTKIIAITFKESTPKNELEQTVEALKKTLSKDTLIVQSTDFSHYLTPENAATHDAQTIKVLNNFNPEQLFGLNQPDNIDSIASQYIQMRLQKDLFHSSLQILEHKNSQDYTKTRVDSTTSYITQAYFQ